MTKTCKKCCQEKPVEAFHTDKQNVDERRGSCKECWQAASLVWQRQNAEKSREYTRQWRNRNPEKAKDGFAKWYSENREYDMARSKAYAKANPAKMRDIHLKYFYNITIEEQSDLLDKQQNCCAICSAQFVRTPHVDHDHKTGQVRGLLCGSCNHGLGMFKDSIESLTKAIDYLRKESPCHVVPSSMSLVP